MNVDQIATRFLAGIITVAALTTVLGRSTAPKVFDSLGNAASNLVSASLGRGVTLR